MIAREDFSIPDGETTSKQQAKRPAEVEKQFFAILREKRPDVVVLDFRKAQSNCAA